MYFSVAPGTVPAAVPCFTGFFRSAAAGITGFQGGRAFFPVAAGTGAVPVLFPARAGVQFFAILRQGIPLCLFRHVITNHTCGG